MDCSNFYLTLCVAIATAFPAVGFLGTPTVTGTVWAITLFRALEYVFPVLSFLQAEYTVTTAAVATSEDVRAPLCATEGG